MTSDLTIRLRKSGRGLHTMLLAAAALLFAPGAAFAAGGEQASFATPDAAISALINANRADNLRQVLRILGRDGRKLVYSGDPIADKLGRAKFVAAYDKAHRIELKDDTTATLLIGDKDWPFPIPLLRRDSAWRFDTRAGVEEILARRIGRNELGAIEVCRAYVDAQREYATRAGRGAGLREYAQHLMSSEGKQDGLYWPAGDGAAASPMGPLLAAARAEGYTTDGEASAEVQPYHGYLYRILKRQGSHAADGARDYLVDGRMVGGFALVAFPARYGDSGVMTFIVNQDGIVYQKNLGPRSATLAREITEFDPDESWSKAATDTVRQ